jgi:hypothetical protein
MLAAKPSERPPISELLVSFSAADMATAQLDVFNSIFGGCCENLLVSKKQHEIHVTRLRKDLKDTESRSRKMAIQFENLLEDRVQDGVLLIKQQGSLTRLKDNYRKLEHSKRRSKAIEDRVVEEKDEDDFTKSWVRSQCEATAIHITQLKERFRDMEIHQMMDTTQTRILHNAATRDAQHEVSARETKPQYTYLSQADTTGGVPIREHKIAVLGDIERGIFIGMEHLEDAFEDLHQQSEHVRYQLRDRMLVQRTRNISPQQKMKEIADDTGKERGRAGVPDLELGAQETAEGHSGAPKAHTVVKREQISGWGGPPPPPPPPQSDEKVLRARYLSKYDKLSKDPGRRLSSGKESVTSLREEPLLESPLRRR